MYAYNRMNWKYVDLGGQELGSAMHQGGYNFLVYFTPEGKARIRPFATGGVHFANFGYPGYSATQGGGSTKFGYNYGAGLKVRVAEIIGFRLDYRRYSTGKPDFSGLFLNQSGRLKQDEFSVGIGVVL
jgi:opacity protein-like surface antigen